MAAACFIEADAGDVQLVSNRLKQLRYYQEKLESLLSTSRVRHIIPDPVKLSNSVTRVMLDHQYITDPVSHVPLLKEAAWHQFCQNLKAVQEIC